MIRVTNIRVSDDGTGATLRALIRCEEPDLDGKEIWFRYPPEYGEYVSVAADPWIAVLLWPAMSLGQCLAIDAPASAELIGNTSTLMSIMHCWDARFHPVEIRTQGTAPQQQAGATVASFFSGGVDSFYTVLKNLPSAANPGGGLTHLISVHGLDIKLRDKALWERILAHLHEASSQLGCVPVDIATNVRDIVPERIVGWPMHYGGVLAAIGLGIRGFWGKVFIPAAQTYAHMYPGGSHPLLDPLWSTESVRIVNDGAEATRIQKVQWQIARSGVALRHLRVCWENRDSKYNCGRCEKCIRTMVNLEIAGVLKRCGAFDRSLDHRDVSRVVLASYVQRTLMAQNYEAALAAGSDPSLIRAIKTCLQPPLHWKIRCALLRRARRMWKKCTFRKVSQQ